MDVATLIPVEQYLNSAYHPDMEFADGVLIGRNVGTPLHSALQFALAAYFGRVIQGFRIKGFTECRLRMNPTRHYIPDVMLVEEPYVRGKVITDVPAVVVEIKSPDDRFDEILEKCLAYESLGVPNIVVLDPDFRRQYVFVNNALKLVSSISLHFPKGNFDLALPMNELFAEMDEGAL